MGGEGLLKAIRETAASAIPPESRTDLIYGAVTSVSPIKVSVENRFEVDASMLILSPWCYEKKITFTIPSHTHTTSTQALEISAHEHTLVDEPDKKTEEAGSVTLQPNVSIGTQLDSEVSVKVWSGLMVGDKVALLRVSSGQQYIVLFKVGD